MMNALIKFLGTIVAPGIILICSVGFGSVVVAQPTPEAVFSYLSLDHPGLEKVKRALADQDIKRAKEELLRYYRNRSNRVFDERVRTSGIDSAKAFLNSVNTFDFRGERRAFGETIDWSYVAVDREWNYTLNRMEWYNNYVSIYERTRDERLVKAWMAQIDSWLKIGNPGYPRTIDTGRRLEALVFSHFMFVTRLKSPSVDADFNARFLASIHEQCEFLFNPEHWRRFSNWGTFENSGFADAAAMFPEFKRAQTWLREIFFRMRTQLQLSYDNNGMHIEVSPSYHAHELKVWCDFIRLTELNGIGNPWTTQDVQPQPRELLKYPAVALAYIMTPTGTYPQLGDTDRRDEVDYLKFLGEFFDDARLKYVASKGREGRPPEETSKAFPETGYFILRSGWGSDAKTFGEQTYVLLDATINKPWHAHLDALSLLLTAGGKDLLIDPGRFTYNEGPDRDQFLSSAAHNTVVINNANQKKTDPKPEASWRFHPSFDFVRASRMQGNVHHQRSVLFAKPNDVIVIDELQGIGRSSCDQYWHLGAEATGSVARYEHGVITPDLIIASSLPSTSLSIDKGFVSYVYREKKEAPVLRYSFVADSAATVVTVLHPREGGEETIRVKGGKSGESGAFTIERDEGYDILVTKRGLQTMKSSEIETDADLVFVRLSKSEMVERMVVIHGSYVRLKKKILYDSFGRPIDLSFDGLQVEANGVNLRKLIVEVTGAEKLILNGEQTKTVHRNGTMIFD